MKIPRGRIKRIYVRRQQIVQDRKSGKRGPALSVQMSDLTILAYQVEIKGPCKLIYQPDKKLRHVTALWIETHAALEVTL